MAAPAIAPGNVSWGFAYLWVAPENEPPPADTVAYGGDWAGNWKFPGASSDGVHRTFTRNTNDLYVEEQSTPVGVVTVNSDYSVTINFAEELIANLKYAYGGGTLTTVVGPPAKTTLALSDTLDRLAIGFDALQSDGKTWRVYVPSVMAGGTVTTDYRRSEGPRIFPATFRAICAISSIIETQFT
jgi:hypothetical protein